MGKKLKRGKNFAAHLCVLVQLDCCRFFSTFYLSLLSIALSNHVNADFLMQFKKIFFLLLFSELM
jgi:hypothetical protein